MNSPNFINPLTNSLFTALVARLLLVYAIAGLLILIVLYRKYKNDYWQSNIAQRYIGWLILTPFYLIGAFCGRVPGLIVVSAFIIGAIIEYGKISKMPTLFRNWMVVLAIWSVITADFFTPYFLSLPLVYFLVITLLAIHHNNEKESFKYASTAMYGSVWLSFSLSYIILLGKFNNSLDGTHILLFLVVFAVACADIGGYIFGKLFHKLGWLDKYKVAPKLSPNKTYIGTLGYIIGAGLAIWLLYFGLKSYMSKELWVIVAILIGVSSFIGGLTHSFFKRYFGVKDSGKLIPGHGGIIDRVDSIARVVVILYYFLKLAI